MAATLDLDGAKLADCNREPIHLLGSIQPHGYLLALHEPGLVLVQASANAASLFGLALEDALGCGLDELLPLAAGRSWSDLLARVPERGSLQLRRLPLPAGGSHGELGASMHRVGATLVVEVEEAAAEADDIDGALQTLVSGFALELQAAASLVAIGLRAARQVRQLIGFDRVLVYRFDEAWNGTVIAEDGNNVLPSYLDLRFPAGDIPRQARELYRLNRQRLIPDASYEPVPIVPQLDPRTGRPLDLTFAKLRSVSPVHVEYMRNMGTAASMSVSLLRRGELWGLIACHHKTPRRLPPHLLAACDLVGQIVSLQLAAEEATIETRRRVEHRSVVTRLLARMAVTERFGDALADSPDLLRLAAASGAAILDQGGCWLIGDTPGEEVVRQIAGWLRGRIGELFATDCLARDMEGAAVWKDSACGLLAIAVSELHPSYVLLFRPEVLRTLLWAGDPHQAGEPGGDRAGPHPRTSFEKWRETVRLRSAPWEKAEIEAARELRRVIVGILLRRAEALADLSQELARSNRRAEELADLTHELERSNSELEAFSYSVSHDLRAPFRHIVGYAELLRECEGGKLGESSQRFLATIIESAVSAGKLVDDLLDFSRMGRSRFVPISIDMNLLVAEAHRQLEPELAGRTVEWRIDRLAPTRGDPVMLRLVLQNLLGNAIKYTRRRPVAVIEIGSAEEEGEVRYFVRDNGVGFDPADVGKLFGVFQRLHRVDEFEGTGIGLANVRRIVERHDGRVWAEGQVDAGATFHFSLPKPQRSE